MKYQCLDLFCSFTTDDLKSIVEHAEATNHPWTEVEVVFIGKVKLP